MPSYILKKREIKLLVFEPSTTAVPAHRYEQPQSAKLYLLPYILGAASANDLLVLRQYRLLDHPSRFSVGGKSNIPIGAVAQLLRRK